MKNTLRRSLRPGLAAAATMLVAGCSANPETDPLIVIGSIVGYALFFGVLGFLIYRGLFGPNGPD